MKHLEGKLKDTRNAGKAGFNIHGKVTRKDGELNWNTALEYAGFSTSDTVNFNDETEILKQSVFEEDKNN